MSRCKAKGSVFFKVFGASNTDACQSKKATFLSLFQFKPDIFRIVLIVTVANGSCEVSGGLFLPTTRKYIIAAVNLRVSLLSKNDPVLRSIGLCETWRCCTVKERKVIVNDDFDRNAILCHLHSVNALVIFFFHGEQFFYTIRFSCERSQHRQEVAVTESLL